GAEGISLEHRYLRRTRDRKLVEERKKKDNYTCQACGFMREVEGRKYIIDVHHLKPLGTVKGVVITSLDDLICLCPNCHRIAHSAREAPLSVEQIKNLLG